jgi:prepilin-type N-terminal cleavage/methylation domain-containing protein
MKYNESGFSLIEIMVAVGLLGALGYVIMQQADMGSKQKVRADFNHLINTQTNAIQKEISKSENCTASFKGLRFGTPAAPTNVNAIYSGVVNNSTTPPTVTRGPVPLYEVNKRNESGIFIESMALLIRGDNKEVLRVKFGSGDVSNTGVVRKKNVPGKNSAIKDFVVMTEKMNTGAGIGTIIDTCYGEQANSLKTACTSMPGGAWNSVTKKCELNDLVTRDDLIQLWSTPSGGLSSTKPAATNVKDVECRCSNKRCSRASGCWCNVPACPAGSTATGHRRFDRRQGIANKECILGAQCMFQSQPAGWMVKP